MTIPTHFDRDSDESLSQWDHENDPLKVKRNDQSYTFGEVN